MRLKNFEARNGNFETSAVVKNPWKKQREQRSLGECWQWKANGQCSKGNNCSFRHDLNKRAKSTQPNSSPRSSTRRGAKCIENQKSESQKRKCGKWRDCRARITSKELAPLHSVKSGILQSACSTSPRVVADLGKVLLCTPPGWWTARKRSKKKVTKVQWFFFFEDYTTIGLRISRYGAAEVYNDFTEELKHTEANPMCSIH